MVYRPSRLTLDAWTVRWFSDTPRDARLAVVGQPDRPHRHPLPVHATGSTGDRLGVANAHWDGASAASRLRSAEALLDWLDPSLPWLVVGDLNATAGDPAVARLVAGGLRDTLAELGERGPQAATHHPWDGSTDGTRIDYVLADDSLGRPGRPHRPLPAGRAPAVRPLAGGGRRRAAASLTRRADAGDRRAGGGTLVPMDALIRPLLDADRAAVARLLDDAVGAGFWSFGDGGERAVVRRRDRRGRGRRRPRPPGAGRR